MLIEHVVSCKSFRVRRNCKGLSLIIFVCLLQVARGSGELELTYSPAFYIICLVYSLWCSRPAGRPAHIRVQYRYSWFKEGLKCLRCRVAYLQYSIVVKCDELNQSTAPNDNQPITSHVHKDRWLSKTRYLFISQSATGPSVFIERRSRYVSLPWQQRFHLICQILARFLGLNRKGRYLSLQKRKENFCVVFTNSVKWARQIRKFHVAVV